MIENYSTTEPIYVQVFPIGAIFNGDYKYSLECINPVANVYNKIYGGDTILPKRPILGAATDIEFNHDFDGEKGGTQASIGFGKYRVAFYEVMEVNEEYIISSEPFDYCDIDFSDYNYPYSNHPPDTLHYYPYHTRDLVIKYYNEDSITYHWNDDLIPETRLIQIWDQHVRNPLAVKSQNKNGFISDVSYSNWPINVMDSGAVDHYLINEFYVNMDVIDNGINFKSNEIAKFENSSLSILNNVGLTVSNDAKISFDGNSNFKTIQTTGKKSLQWETVLQSL